MLAAFFARFDETDDIGVGHAAVELGFALETLDGFEVVVVVGDEGFDGDEVENFVVEGGEDGAHAAYADLAEDGEPAEIFA